MWKGIWKEFFCLSHAPSSRFAVVDIKVSSFKTPQKIIYYLFNNDDFILFCNFFLLGHGQLFLGGRLFGMYRDFCEKFLASFAFFGHGYFLYRQLFVQFRELLTGDKQFAEPAIQAVALKDKSSMYNRMAPRKNSRLISRVYFETFRSCLYGTERFPGPNVCRNGTCSRHLPVLRQTYPSPPKVCCRY